jgi:hypothetical protein
MLAGVVRSPSRAGPVALGIFNAFLPCQLIYAFAAHAASTVSPRNGLRTMVAFGSPPTSSWWDVTRMVCRGRSKAAAMNAAQGTEKVDAIAAVVNELVAQHRAMHGDQGCPGGCPMMKEMKEKMGGMMGSGTDHGAMEHGGMQHDVPTPPSGGATR